jgi:hypothetical protein
VVAPFEEECGLEGTFDVPHAASWMLAGRSHAGTGFFETQPRSTAADVRLALSFTSCSRAAPHLSRPGVAAACPSRLPSCYPLFWRRLMASKITVAAAIALAAIVAAPSASLAASKAKAKDSYRDVTKCEGGACTAVNPDRDFINTSRNAQYYRSTHKKHKTRPKK